MGLVLGLAIGLLAALGPASPGLAATRSGGTSSAPSGYPRLIFQDTFTGTTLNSSNWNTYMTSGSSGGAPWFSNGAGGSSSGAVGGYEAEYYEPSQVSVDNGLTLSATSGSSEPGYQWTSGVVSSYGHFQFDGGYVQIKAEVPGGDGMWPTMWMLPGKGTTQGNNFEIDIFEGNFLGNGVNPNDNYAWHLHTLDGTGGNASNTGENLTTAYHTYGMAWVPNKSVTWYLDGREIGQITSAQYPIPNEQMELIMDLAVGNSTSSSWRTAYDSSTPSPSTMKVASVQVYQS